MGLFNDHHIWRQPIVISLLLITMIQDVDCLSVSSCSDLGWTNAATFGDTLVCAETDLGLGKCSEDLEYTQARIFCQSKWNGRGRLCTRSELLNNEAQDAGCGYDAEFLWTGEFCEGPGTGFLSDGSTTSCVDLASLHKVRCCADSTYGEGDCSGLKKWGPANGFCSTKGARLCTITELQNFEPKNTGCNYERKLVWSSTACVDHVRQIGTFNGYYQAWGSADFGTNTPCVHPKKATGHVRCCADVF